MEGVPHLSASDLRADLMRLYQSGGRRHHLFAYFGTGEEQLVKLDNAGDVVVVPVRSELELRARLPALGDEESRIAFLVPWTHDVSLDIAGRFALNGRVRRIGKEVRMLQLFGVGEMSEEARRSPLMGYLLRPGGERRYPVGDGFLTAHAMWDAWLAKDWGIPTSGGLALDALLAWAATDNGGARFTEAMRDEHAVGVHQSLLEHLQERLGDAGPVVWRAWEAGKGPAAVEMAALFEVLARDRRQDIALWVTMQMRELGLRDEAASQRTARSLGQSAAGAFRLLEQKEEPRFVHGLLRRADERADVLAVRQALATSTRLPSAWNARLDTLGAALAEGAREPTDANLQRSVASLRELEAHASFQDPAQRAPLERVEMAVRLLAWLAARPDQRLRRGLTPHSDAEILGRWYAEEGGYVDWARRVARHTDDVPLSAGVRAVVDAADQARTELDRRFALGLRAWLEAGQPSHQVLPIQDAAKRVVAKFLEGQPERRLLVLLMDGMAWAQAVQLLASMDELHWAPLAWHRTKAGRIGEGAYPPVFAALPTTTEVSRAAFFAGKLPKPGARLDTSKDPKHWAEHPQIKRFSSERDLPRLLLRGEGHTKGGSASSEALALVADSKRRVVAMVLNVIDDSLKASHALRLTWGVEAIAPLRTLLEHARRHGRSVLLASDHGHVPADRTERVRQPHPAAGAVGGGARWRPWAGPEAPVGDNEIAVKGSNVYTPKGAHGIVLLTDDESIYAGNTHAGDHGGATLAEVVAPCVLIGCADVADDFVDDPALGLSSRYVPRWWHFVVDETPVPLVDEPVEPPKAKPKPKDEKQLGLVGIAPPPAPKVSAFGRSEVLAARGLPPERRVETVRAVELLLARNGAMSTDAFASEMDFPEWRVAGLVAKLQEVLNLDGYQVLRHEAATKQVHLDVDKLAQLFEVKL